MEGQPFLLRDYELVCLGKLPSQFLQENIIQKIPMGPVRWLSSLVHLAQSRDFHSGWQESTDIQQQCVHCGM